MLMEKIQLWEDNEHVNLFTYILNNSQEFRANEKRPAVIICPGGAYLGTSDREAEPVAMRFASQGYHTFVLRYNTYFTQWVSDFNNPPKGNEKTRYPGPVFDLAKAMMVIKENADKWFVDPDKISICGFSAGAHLCASMGVHWQDEFLKEEFKAPSETFKPNTVILGYPLLDYTLMKEKLNESSDEMGKGLFKISNTAVFGTPDPSDEELEKLSPANYITSNTPPTFIWHTAEDSLVYVENSLKFALQLSKHKIPYELHVFENGPHGLSLCDETTAGEESHINPHAGVWFDIGLSWMKKYN